MKTTKAKISFVSEDPQRLYQGGLYQIVSCLDPMAATLQWMMWEIAMTADLTSLGMSILELNSEIRTFPPKRFFSWRELKEIVRNIEDVEDFVVAGYGQQVMQPDVSSFSSLVQSAAMIISIEDSTYLEVYGVENDLIECLLTKSVGSGLKRINRAITTDF